MHHIETFSTAALVTPHPLATAAGRGVLIEGGTAIEAAIAAAAVTAVVRPDANGIGGDAVWLIREPGRRGRVRVLDARGLTAAEARPSFYRDRGHEAVPREGPLSILSAPGAAAGWAAAHDLSTALGGRLPVDRLLAAALAAARDGVALSAEGAEALAAAGPGLRAAPGFADAFLADRELPEAGALRRSPALADTLDYLARAGLDDLYRGDVAAEVSADLARLGSPLSRRDLRETQARWREPASLDLGRTAIDAVPDRRGTAVALALGLWAGLAMPRRDGFEGWHGLVEAWKRAERLIATSAGADGAGEPPLDRAGLAREALAIDRNRASRDPVAAPPIQDERALWIGVVDRDGAAVSLVQTLGGPFGSGVVAGRTGLLLGNRGAGTSVDPGADVRLWPGRRLGIASVPLLVSARDGSVATLGATGLDAPVIASQLAAGLLAGESLGSSLAAPRFLLGPNPDGAEAAVSFGDDAEASTLGRMRAAGHALVRARDASPGRVAGAATRLASGRLEAVSDRGSAGGF